MGWFRVAFAAVVVAFVSAFSPQIARADEHAPKVEPCTERCFVVDRMRLTGKVGSGALHFEIEGAVSAVEATAVPLFGPPDQVRIDGVTESGRAATIGFQDDHYFAILPGAGASLAAPRRFVVRGDFTMTGDLALVVPGPLNTIEAAFTKGTLIEGDRLSGLVKSTVHFDAGERAAPPPPPPVHDLTRAIRVGPEVRFEYHLVLQSSSDLGVVHLPLRMGERVTGVTGSTGWREAGGELALPSSGIAADFTVTGVLPKLGRLTPDASSLKEQWLIESDAEHHLTFDGDAKAFDVSTAPFPRIMSANRAFLVLPGQHIDVKVESLTSLEVLAAVVRAQDRTVVITDQNDLVADEQISYENNGVDHLRYTPNGRPLFLATDGDPERILRAEGSQDELLIALQAGAHRVRTQSIERAALRSLAGSFDVPMARQPLVASHASLTLGLPERVHPVAVLGGDTAWWRFERDDLAALGASLLVMLVAFRGARRRALAAVALFGLWLVAPSTFVALFAALVVGSEVWLLPRLVRSRFVAGAGVVATMAVCGGFVAAFVAHERRAGRADENGDVSLPMAVASGDEGSMGNAGSSRRYGTHAASNREESLKEAANFGMIGLLASPAATREGVRPVALSLPRDARRVVVTRELVTSEVPFQPRLVYVTSRGIALLESLWIAIVVALAWTHRAALRDLVARARERIAAGRPPAGPGPVTRAPPVPVVEHVEG